ncbi:glycosyltransferase family 2 protein [Aestuariimicrobium soli]|uniref:glycosyltransferase family 2 protein n=1 Tax=Aestuariimicrobium soli TaxID=2035834 RepID=UPI003EBE41E9
MVPSRGGARRLPLLLATLAAQTHPDWEAVVVLDGDVDGSESVVRRFADVHDDLAVRTVVFPENRGRVAALNAGFAEATGDVLIRADDDFELSPGHVAAHVAPHEAAAARGERVGVVGLPENVAPDNAYARAYGAWADQTGRANARATPPDERWRLWGGNVSCTREVYVELGGYDARYRGYGWEDLDFGYRLRALGIPIELADGATVRHHLASVTTAIRARRAWDSGAARARFEQIHGPGSSGRAVPLGDDPWNRLVRASANRLDERRLDRWTATVDRMLPVVPRPVGRKLVAWAVESAAVAGFTTAAHAQGPAAGNRPAPGGSPS